MSNDFIRTRVLADLASGKYGGRVVTRFPPEPNGYPHLGHAKSICLNFGLAQQFGGRCHLRYDDTNPTTESQEYVDAMLRDIRWLGFEPGEHVYFASDYYEQLYDYAVRLVELGKAYVCPLDEEQIRIWRGTVSEPGRPSPGREHTIAQNLDLLHRMRAGEFPDGAYTLRARIDMSAANMKLRDPLLYRIRHATHYRRGDAWCIYPMYDYAHPLSDAIEGITHSICTLEFENNRDIYDWLLQTLGFPTPPEQTEFARLVVNGTLTSKRKLLRLVDTGALDGWDDPRVTTLAGMRRRGYPASALRAFCERVGVARALSTVEFAQLEDCLRDDLNPTAPRVMAVLRPLKVTITNWPGGTETLDAPLFPPDVGQPGSRPVPFTGELYIERDDFAEHPPKGWHRLAPGAEVRLRHAYVVRCDEVVKEGGEVVELRCSYDPATRSGSGGRKVKGTVHWVSATASQPAEVRLYEPLFLTENPGDAEEILSVLNPDSVIRITGARLEPWVFTQPADTRFQFERLGFFWRDPEHPDTFGRIVALKDAWARAKAREGAKEDPRSAPAVSPTEAPAPAARAHHLSPEASERAAALAAAGLAEADARRIAEVPELQDWALAAAAAGEPASIGRWIANELLRDLKERALGSIGLTPAALARLAHLADAGSLTMPSARLVYAALLADGGDVDTLARAHAVVEDPAVIAAEVARVVAANPAQLAAWRGGKVQLAGFFVGQVMKALGGRARPDLVSAAVKAALDGGSGGVPGADPSAVPGAH